jgi:HNH endonuclease
MKMKLFTKEEVLPMFAEYGRMINGGHIRQLSPLIASRVKASTVATGHGTDTRVLQYHLWVVGQVFDKRYFKYEVQHDPVPRYTGTDRTNWAIQFYMNKIRGAYHEREAIVDRVRREAQSAQVGGFQFEEDKQAVLLIHRFEANTLLEVQTEINNHLFDLINAIHPSFCAIIDAFGVEISKEERLRIIAGTVRPTGVNRLSPAFGSAPHFNRNVPPHLRQKIFERDLFTCKYCGLVGTAPDLHADHILAVKHGGLTIIGNLQTLCSACNLRKGGRLTS